MLQTLSWGTPVLARTAFYGWSHARTVAQNTDADLTQVPTHWPVQDDLLGYCHALAPGFAILLILGGIVFMLFGFSIFKILVTLNAAVLGGYVGMVLGERNNVEMPAAIVVALIAATAAWPTMKYSVAIMGALFGAVLGVTFWRMSNLDPNFGWSGGMTGLVFSGLLSLLLFRQCVMTYTSLQGAVMLVFGILALVFKYEEVGGSLIRHFQLRPFLLPLVIFVSTLLGFIYQQTTAVAPVGPPAPPKKA